MNPGVGCPTTMANGFTINLTAVGVGYRGGRDGREPWWTSTMAAVTLVGLPVVIEVGAGRDATEVVLDWPSVLRVFPSYCRPISVDIGSIAGFAVTRPTTSEYFARGFPEISNRRATREQTMSLRWAAIETVGTSPWVIGIVVLSSTRLSAAGEYRVVARIPGTDCKAGETATVTGSPQ